MKTYNEMAHDVLERAHAQMKKKKKVRAVLSSVAAGCVAALTLCLFAGGGNTPVLPSVGDDTAVFPSTEGSAPATEQYFLQYVCYSNENISESSLDQSIPMQFVLEATDVQGLSETEIQQILQQKKQDLAPMEQAWTEAGYAYRVSSVHQKNAVIVYAVTGGFRLDVEDWSKVKEIRGKCASAYGKIQCAVYANAWAKKSLSYRLIDEDGTEHLIDKPVYHHGNCWIYGQNIIIPGDSLRGVYEDIQKGEGSLLFSWEPTQALFDALAADVNFDLPPTTFSFTLCYEDGTEIEHTFIAESHDGIGYITYTD